MLLVAYAYRGLNLAAPDAATSFTWTVKAFGPHIGWLFVWQARAASLFRGETLKKDTPTLIVED